MMVAVIALAQRKNLEPTGKELGVSASAVHKRIHTVNQLLGTPLFIGTSDGFELTEVGEALYAQATRAVEQALLTEEVAIAASELYASHLLVGHSTYLPARLLALIHSLPFTSALGIRLEHKPGLTLTLAQDVVKGALHAGAPLDAIEAAKIVGMNSRTLVLWARRGYVPAHPLGEGKRRIWRFFENELLEWVERQKNDAVNELPRDKLTAAIDAHAKEIA